MWENIVTNIAVYACSGGALFCSPGLLPPLLFLMAGGSLTAQIPPLTSVIMRAQTGIDLQNDGLTMGTGAGPQTPA